MSFFKNYKRIKLRGTMSFFKNYYRYKNDDNLVDKFLIHVGVLKRMLQPIYSDSLPEWFGQF